MDAAWLCSYCVNRAPNILRRVVTSDMHPAAVSTVWSVLYKPKCGKENGYKDITRNKFTFYYHLQCKQFALVSGLDLITCTHSRATSTNNEIISGNGHGGAAKKVCMTITKMFFFQSKEKRTTYPPLKSYGLNLLSKGVVLTASTES